jgi:hypothetical protein
MMRVARLGAIPVVMLLLGAVVGYLLGPSAGVPDPTVRITGVMVEPAGPASGPARLRITTHYSNSGCTQVLLARFLINSHPAPSIALPQQQGPAILPVDENVYVEDLALDFPLTRGTWHMFSVASCYRDGELLPSATVAPTALFDVAEAGPPP